MIIVTLRGQLSPGLINNPDITRDIHLNNLIAGTDNLNAMPLWFVSGTAHYFTLPGNPSL